MAPSSPRSTVISVRVDSDSLQAIDLLLRAGLAQSRSDAASQLVALGINAAGDLLARARQVADELQQLRQSMLAAVKAHDVAEVKALLEHNPELIRSFGDGGDTPVLLSVYYGADELTRLLLEQNPELSLFEAAAIGDRQRLEQLLSAQPEAINSYSHDGWTALHLAAFFGRQQTLELLLERGADLGARARNQMANLPLHAALAGRRHESARWLITSGADVNSSDGYGWSPLHHAAYGGDLEIVRLLLARGAHADVRDGSGRSPLAVARERGHADVVAALARHPGSA